MSSNKEKTSRTTRDSGKKKSSLPKARSGKKSNSKSRKTKSRKTYVPVLADLYKYSDDPDWFSRLCACCKADRKVDRNALLVNVSYEDTAIPLYKAYRGVPDPNSLLFFQATACEGFPLTAMLPKNISHRIAMQCQSFHPPTLVVDIGSSSVKVGWAGDYNPTMVFPTLVGRTNWQPTPVGYDALPFRNCIDLVSPVGEDGKISVLDWPYIENIIAYVIKKLNVVAEETSIFLSFPTLSYHDQDNKTIANNFVSLIFDKYSFASASFSTRESLSLLASGKTTGTVVHVGHHTSVVVPVYEGYSLMDAAQSNPWNGAKLTDHLNSLLVEKGTHLTGFVERNVVRDMKEKLCYIRTDPKSNHDDATYTSPYFLPSSASVATDYTLGDECWKCPEKLFDSEFGLQHSLYSSLYLATAANSELLSTFFQNIVLTGGSTKFTGFEERLKREVSALIPESLNVPVHVSGHPARQTASWRGGSIRASLSAPAVTMEQYNEIGPYRAFWTSLY